jgi:hypothetical protein
MRKDMGVNMNNLWPAQLRRLRFLAFLLFSATAASSLESQTFEWAISAGGTDNDVARNIAADGLGNSYLVGFFRGTATVGTFNLPSAGELDVVVIKYDLSGNVVWAASAGGERNDIGLGIAVDYFGDTYITGRFSGTATFGPVTLTGAGSPEVFFSSDVFVAKYDKNGNVLWAKSFGPAAGESIALDNAGNFYLTGYFAGTATFGSYNITSAGELDIFVVKCDSVGNVLWARSGGGTVADQGLSIAVDSFGNSYVTGVFGETATFDSVSLTSVAGSADVFVAKYDSTGSVMWARSAGGADIDQGYGIAVDAEGNSHVAGVFRGNATFGSFTLISNGADDIFVAKYDPDGNVVWTQSAGGISLDSGYGIAIDTLGNSYITGSFVGTVMFGAFKVASAGGTDVFVAKYDSTGNVLWANSAGGTWQDSGHGIAVVGPGSTLITGPFRETAAFGTINLTSIGNNDIFVARVSEPSPPIPALTEWSVVVLVLLMCTVGSIVFGVARRRPHQIRAQSIQ